MVRTRGYYIASIFPCGFVWSITLISWAYLLWVMTVGHLPTNGFGKFFFGYACLEVPFSIYYRYLCFKAQNKIPPPPLDVRYMREMLIQCLDVGLSSNHEGPRRPKTSRTSFDDVPETTAYDLREQMRKWFFEAPFEDIYADNIREWLAWSMAGMDLRDAMSDPQAAGLINEALVWAEKRCATKFPPGRNPHVKCSRLTLDKVQIMQRPLGYYVVCNGATLITYTWLFLHGFRYSSVYGCGFLVRRGRNNGKQPIVLLHGLGVGLAQYFILFSHLVKLDQPIVLLLQPHISAEIWHPRFLDSPSKQDTVAAIKSTMDKYSFEKATILSHSNGTMVHSWVLRGLPELCHKNILVDPVCFRLWEADVCYNFVYRTWCTGMENLLGYFVARELGTAHTIGRHFIWTDMMLWEHEVPNVDPDLFHVVMAGRDFLVNAEREVAYLSECGVDQQCMTIYPHYQHGQALVTNCDGMNLVLSKIKD